MPDLIKKTGQAANFQWGLPSGVNLTTYGRVQSFRSGRASEKELLKDKDGNTDGVIYYDLSDDGTLEAILPASGLPSLEIANTVQINGKTYHIENFEHNWTAGAWAKITLTLKHYEGVAVGSGSGS